MLAPAASLTAPAASTESTALTASMLAPMASMIATTASTASTALTASMPASTEWPTASTLTQHTRSNHSAQKLRARGRPMQHRYMRAHAPAEVRQRPSRAPDIAPHAAGPCATCNRCNLHASGWHAKAYGLRKRALTNAPDSRVQRKGSDEGPPKRQILTRAQQVRADRLDRMPPRRTPRSGLSTAKNAIAPKTDTSETRNDWGICTHWRATLCSACADAPPPVLPTSRTSSPFRSAPR